MKPLLVIKIGTSAITTKGEVDEDIIAEICRQAVVLHDKYRIVIVSSGAVGSGKNFLKGYTGKMQERKTAAAIGNPLLIQKYAKCFAEYEVFVAQILSERKHFSDRESFLQLRSTFEKLWENQIVPIVNENDVVSNNELKFSDNDELASLISVGFSADKLFFCTTVDGLLNKGDLVPKIKNFDEEIFGMTDKKMSEGGLGGMDSKLHFAKLATRFGTEVIILNGRTKGSLLLAEEGQTGTVCVPRKCEISDNKRWIASSGVTTAKVIIDEGAKGALLKRKSLLLVGVKEIVGEFDKGEIFEIYGEGSEEIIAVGKAKVASVELGGVGGQEGD